MEKKILYEVKIEFKRMSKGFPAASIDTIFIAEDNLNGACLTAACWANQIKEKFVNSESATYRIVEIKDKEIPVYISGKGAL